MEAKETKSHMARANSYQSLNLEPKNDTQNPPSKRRRFFLKLFGVIVVTIVVISIVILILALTIFKPKNPKTEIVSAQVEGISPRVTLPVVRVELNVTLNLKILVKNRNYASFRHGTGTSDLLYRGKRVGEAEIFPGDIPARGSATVPCRLNLEIDELGSEIGGLVSDVLGGELEMETRTRIPGRVTFLGFVKKHVVAVSECRFVVGVGDLKVRSQECENETKF